MLASNTGLGGCSALFDLVEGRYETDEERDELKKCIAHIDASAVSIQNQADIIRRYLKARNPLAPLIACAGCGVR